MSVVLAGRVDAAVAAALDRLNGDLEALVDRALAERIEQLVAERLSETRKTCRTCGEVKPADQYEKRRGTCKSCRRRQERKRAQARAHTEGDRPAVDDRVPGSELSNGVR